MCLQGEADANKVSEHVTLGYTQATTATTGGQLLADSVEKVAASPCRWQNCSVSERGGEQHDGAVTGRTAAPVLLVQPRRSRPGSTPPAQHRPVPGS